MIKSILVRLGNRSYPVVVGDHLLRECASHLLRATPARKVAILAGRWVFDRHGRKLGENLKKAGFEIHPILISDGESGKNERTLFRILGKMAKSGFRRDSCLICLGGGVVGDLGGLAASLYMRGIDFVQCPTTLLAQVDASLGGKTAIDFMGIKNLIGTFHQPRLVLIDPTVLQTLGDRQFKTGLAEVVKYGIIQDPALFHKMETSVPMILKRETGILNYLIERSCRIKAGIVSADEKEGGKRAWLNYGHTLGHALESYFRFGVLTHGEAIAHGMRFAALLSRRLGFCGEDVVQRSHSLLTRIGLLRKLPGFNPRDVYQKMSLDKKARSAGIQFVLTRKIGLVTIQKNIPKTLLLSVLDQFQNEANNPR